MADSIGGHSAEHTDYSGVQRAIEDQLQSQGWRDIRAEEDRNRLIIEAVLPAEGDDQVLEDDDAPGNRYAGASALLREMLQYRFWSAGPLHGSTPAA